MGACAGRPRLCSRSRGGSHAHAKPSPAGPGLHLARPHGCAPGHPRSLRSAPLLRPRSPFMKTAEDEDVLGRIAAAQTEGTARGSIDPRLRAWSQGVTDGKTFQGLTEEFAEIVIPRVWEQEDRKITRVAKGLKVSPKKMRRILAGQIREKVELSHAHFILTIRSASLPILIT